MGRSIHVFIDQDTLKVPSFTANPGDWVCWHTGDLPVRLVFNDEGDGSIDDSRAVFGLTDYGPFTGTATLIVKGVDPKRDRLHYRIDCPEAPMGYLLGDSHPVMIIKKP
jgi:hypothetical protein